MKYYVSLFAVLFSFPAFAQEPQPSQQEQMPYQAQVEFAGMKLQLDHLHAAINGLVTEHRAYKENFVKVNQAKIWFEDCITKPACVTWVNQPKAEPKPGQK